MLGKFLVLKVISVFGRRKGRACRWSHSRPGSTLDIHSFIKKLFRYPCRGWCGSVD